MKTPPKSPSDKPRKASDKKHQKKKTAAAQVKTAAALAHRPAPAMVGKPVLKQASAPAPATSERPVLEKASTPAPAMSSKSVLKKASEPAPAISGKRVLEPTAPARIVSAPAEPGLEGAAHTIEWSFEAAAHGALAINRKLLDITVQNVKSSLDFAKRLAGAKTPIEVMQMQVSYWQERMGALASQAEELRALSAHLVSRSGRT
ncbi:MAG: phasin family protein [Methyloceanibacter sp.]